MLRVDCTELSQDEQLALASSISDRFEGRAVALLDGSAIVLDEISGEKVAIEDLRRAVEDFVTRRKDASLYSLEVADTSLVIRSPDPVKSRSHRRPPQLPPNIMKCPFCSFVTPYDELYQVHTRSHGFV